MLPAVVIPIALGLGGGTFLGWNVKETYDKVAGVFKGEAAPVAGATPPPAGSAKESMFTPIKIGVYLFLAVMAAWVLKTVAGVFRG